MATHRIRRGLDLPITGEPKQDIEEGPTLKRVAVMADDVIGLRPRMIVSVDQTVKRGEQLFEHRKVPGLFVTAPAAGKVVAIHRGARRALQSVVIEISDNEDNQSFESYTGKDPGELDATQVRALLCESGSWAALRQRPFSTVPAPDADAPHAIFVTAVDSNPHAPDMDRVVDGRSEDLARGLRAIGKLTAGNVYLCCAAGSKISNEGVKNVRVENFEGKHPAGNVGTHIHTLAPVNRTRPVWHLGVQDVLAIGHLFATGELDVKRVVSLAGPAVKTPRLIRTRLGASIDEIVAGESKDGENRVVAGSVFTGRAAAGEVHGFLGRFHQQISILAEGRERVLFGWLGPGFNSYSTINTFLAKLIPGKKFDFTTTTNGSRRAMVPIGMYERVMPLDIMPTFLLRAIAMSDIERAEELGVLELDEEDLALCTFVCPGKTDYGPLLRSVLDEIIHEG